MLRNSDVIYIFKVSLSKNFSVLIFLIFVIIKGCDFMLYFTFLTSDLQQFTFLSSFKNTSNDTSLHAKGVFVVSDISR